MLNVTYITDNINKTLYYINTLNKELYIMQSEILATKTIKSNDLDITLNLVSYADFGYSQFDEKWIVSDSGVVVGDYHTFDCAWYEVGKDCTIEQAQKEYDRDRDAFDVHLHVTITRNGVTLIDNDPVIGADYNYQEDANDLLKYLIGHFDQCYYENQAYNELEALRKALA